MNDSEEWTVDTTGKEIPTYIAIEGPIGVGKTTLAQYLAKSFHYDTLLERAEENPFLERFYTDNGSTALPTQLYFLFQRVQQVNDLRQADIFRPKLVADFLIEKDPLFAQVTLDDNELNIYQQVYKHLTVNAPTPDLVIYLQAPEDILLERIKKRGIPAEQHIDADYLTSLNNAYTRFFHYYDEAPLLIVNTAEIDWVNNAEDYQKLVEFMLQARNGRHYYNPEPSIFA